MRLLFATLLFAVMPALGLAQTSVDVAAAGFGPESQRSLTEQLLHVPTSLARNEGLLPLWSTPDGRVLALVALGSNNATPILPQSPQIGSAVDWHWDAATGLGRCELRVGQHAVAIQR